MRLHLDTNTLAFLLARSSDDIHVDVRAAINNDANVLSTSCVCVMELIHLCQVGKLPHIRGVTPPSAADVFSWLDDNGIAIVDVTRRHLAALAALPLYPDHRDPCDRLIVAQAIADRAVLVSSDRKLPLYRRDGLDLLFNER